VIAFRDITELEREKRHFKIESMMDHLTQLYNKRTFEHFLRDKLEEIREFHRDDVAIVMFDIDHFKRVNDRYGHQKGDEVLRTLAREVASDVRKSDFLVRWGGEEFVIVMENSTLEAACRKAEELRRRIEGMDFGIEWRVTCSFGVTMLRSDDSPESAVERVDRILYRAKNEGRNRVICDE
jgi:diguanylate cyclase (GGDEF)-like protein